MSFLASLTTPPNNFIGATAFINYLVETAVFTGVIIQDVKRRFSIGRNLHPKAGDLLQRFSAIATLVAGVLAYHMINYFRLSYQNWAVANGMSPAVVTPESVWRWLTGSMVFEAFAKELLSDNLATMWSQFSLTWAMGISLYIASEGQRRDVTILWAYPILAQFCGISFVQTLFFMGVIVSPGFKPIEQKVEKKEGNEPPPPPELYPYKTPNPYLVLIALVTLVYLVVLHSLPYAQDTPYYLPLCYLLRFLLIVPSLLPAEGAIEPSILMLVAVTGISTSLRSSALLHQKIPFMEILQSINRTPPSSVLGYDVILSIVSGIFWMLA